jgi:hypothetical protein
MRHFAKTFESPSPLEGEGGVGGDALPPSPKSVLSLLRATELRTPLPDPQGGRGNRGSEVLA